MEKTRLNDYFADDLAGYYAHASLSQRRILKRAQTAVKNGYEFCLQDNFSAALNEFVRARQLFLEAGNFFEAETIGQHFIAYCFYNTDRRGEAVNLFQQVDAYCRKKNYRWLRLMNFYWLTGSEESIGLRSSTRTREDYETSLTEAQELDDFFMIQKFLLALTAKSAFLRQGEKTLFYLQNLLEFSKRPNLSSRQKFRNYNKIIESLATTGNNTLMEEVALESTIIADALIDPLFAIGAQINAGMVYTQNGNFDQARAWLFKAQQKAEMLSEAAQQKAQLAKIFLELGHLERKSGRLLAAADFYTRSLDISKQNASPSLVYETQKSRLLVDQLLGNDAEVEKDLSSVVALAEKYRSEILGEEERNSFFDNAQDIYDIAIEHERRQGRSEEAFNYAEASNARSLLDRLHQQTTFFFGGSRAGGGGKSLFSSPVQPLKIDEIRERMPAEVQILQYAVIEDKILIWLITKEKFLLTAQEVNSQELKEKIKNYLTLLQSGNRAEQKERINLKSQELYRLLINPVLKYLDRNKEICLVPNKSLLELPFAALISPEGNYFLEDFVFFYAPSANVFLLSTKSALGKAKIVEEGVLSVGDPGIDRKRYSDLAELEDAKAEAEEIAKEYQTKKVLTGREATKSAFQAIYKDFEVIHFAGHYLNEPRFPLKSKLLMARVSDNEIDNVLTNAELLSISLPRTRLVVLSACQTGLGNNYNGEGSVGLARTFLSAGVSLVVATQWAVDSRATSVLMRKFHYYRRSEKTSTVQALRRAQLELLRDPNQMFDAPYFWAAFAAIGGYAEF